MVDPSPPTTAEAPQTPAPQQGRPAAPQQSTGRRPRAKSSRKPAKLSSRKPRQEVFDKIRDDARISLLSMRDKELAKVVANHDSACLPD